MTDLYEGKHYHGGPKPCQVCYLVDCRVLVPVDRGIYVTGDFDSVSDMMAAAQDPNRHVTFQWVGEDSTP